MSMAIRPSTKDEGDQELLQSKISLAIQQSTKKSVYPEVKAVLFSKSKRQKKRTAMLMIHTQEHALVCRAQFSIKIFTFQTFLVRRQRWFDSLNKFAAPPPTTTSACNMQCSIT